MDIKELRSQLGMKRTKFAEWLGIPVRSIVNWEGGERSCPEYVARWIAKEVQERLERTVPIDIEELRKLKPEPVWIESKYIKGWHFVNGHLEYKEDGIALLLIDRAGRVADFPVAEYGESWNAYRRNPTEV